MLPLRDDLVDWILAESAVVPEDNFAVTLTEALERLLSLRYRPPELTGWNDAWFEPMRLFVYEVFVYTIAALIRNKRFRVVHEVFATNYLLPESVAGGDNHFDTFDAFYGYSEVLRSWNRRENRRRLSPVADLMKERATRSDLDFNQIIQADLVIFLVALAHENARWYPQTLIYAGYGGHFPLFVRAARHRYFQNLALITGIESADALREAVNKGYERMGVERWTDLTWRSRLGPLEAMHREKWDTLS